LFVSILCFHKVEIPKRIKEGLVFLDKESKKKRK